MAGPEHEVDSPAPAVPDMAELAPSGTVDAPSVAGLLRLQRTAGNAAVARQMHAGHAGGPALHVQRQPTRDELDASYNQAVLAGDWGKAAEILNGFNDPDIGSRIGALSHEQRVSIYVGAAAWVVRVLDTVARIDLPAAYTAAMRRQDWAKACVLLNGFNDGDIDTRAAALSGAERTSMLTACPEWAHRVRRPILDLEYRAAVGAGSWETAANFLNAFNDADITTRVVALSHDQRILLYVAAPVRIGDLIATADLEAAYQGDIRKRDWARAAVHLNGFNDADIQTRVAALSPADRAAMLAACPDWAHRVRAPILDVEFQAAVAAGTWDAAARFLNGFNDADITTRVTALTHDQRISLYLVAPVRIGDIIATVDLEAAYQGAVRKPDWARAAVHLNGFNDPDIETRVAALSPADRAAMLAACPAWVTRVRIPLIGRPTETYLVPFDRSPHSSPGERIIFNAEYTHATPNQFKLVFSGTGGTFDSAGGPAAKTVAGLTSGNVFFHIDAAWTGTTATSVQLQIQLTDGTVVTTANWAFVLKTNPPTTMVQAETEGERPMPSMYSYQLGPDIGPPGHPDYEHQTILERFEQRSCNITLAELKPAYATAHGLTDAASITAHFFGTSSSNGTFTIDADDKVYDQHGGMPDKPVFEAALIVMKEVTCDLPQIYEVRPGVPLARYTVRRIMHVDGSKALRKFRTGP